MHTDGCILGIYISYLIFLIIFYIILNFLSSIISSFNWLGKQFNSFDLTKSYYNKYKSVAAGCIFNAGILFWMYTKNLGLRFWDKIRLVAKTRYYYISLKNQKLVDYFKQL